MTRFAIYALLLLSLVFVGCGRDEEVKVSGVKGGWSKSTVDTLIGCQPSPGPVCDCLIPRVVAKYTAEQVKQNSALVAQDLLTMKNSCGGGPDVGGKSSPTAAPKTNGTTN